MIMNEQCFESVVELKEEIAKLKFELENEISRNKSLAVEICSVKAEMGVLRMKHISPQKSKLEKDNIKAENFCAMCKANIKPQHFIEATTNTSFNTSPATEDSTRPKDGDFKGHMIGHTPGCTQSTIGSPLSSTHSSTPQSAHWSPYEVEVPLNGSDDKRSVASSCCSSSPVHDMSFQVKRLTCNSNFPMATSPLEYRASDMKTPVSAYEEIGKDTSNVECLTVIAGVDDLKVSQLKVHLLLIFLFCIA